MQQSILLNDTFELFLLDCQASSFTPHTLRFYRGRLSLFVNWCGKQDVAHLHTLQAAHIRSYFVDMQSRGLSSAYIHSHARAIRTFCNYAVRDNLLEVSPFSRVKMPRLERKILPALTDTDVTTILKCCDSARDRAVVLFLLDSGVRASELVGLTVGDVNLKTGCVTVHQGKGQKARHTFIGSRTRKFVRLYLTHREQPSSTDPLFVSERGGQRMTYSGLAQMLRRLKRQSGVKVLSAHACRRTFAISCLRSGMDLFVLGRLMGHSDITVLRQYLAILDDDLAEAHDRSGPVDNMF